ncbi:squamosa promoter-binding-like protein 17 [Olea europaea var. sylvestris]|uniref:squamosa promoter-binding-like protein 17 n=1 Tax=Olea europaea var. sylvestris TaxID=158386 RepID=UPI000C1D6C24|nr:squamosa promoter-binding-like protein 17 [Olea europaea var. sylvestris]XP_022882653.1 squamosa promoter-binding-like protein 17 [Olea europaea var. sylvestris]
MELGSASSSSSASGGSDSLNGLKFGKKIYFEDVGVGVQDKFGGGPPSLPPIAAGLPPPSPAKKGRIGVGQSGQPSRCQVEGCNVDLSDAKAYYSRHKVCGMHSKFPRVTVAGLEQRFCQQCSRFHQLPEFDQGKRSCRRRLAGHNERRRKLPPGSLLSTRYGNLSSSIFENHGRTGGFVMDFATNPNLTGRDSWPNTMSSERVVGNQVKITGKFARSWQDNLQNPPPDLLQGLTTRVSYLGPGVSSEECYSGVSDSSSALSLLSNQPWGSRNHSSSHGENSSLDANGTPLVQPLVTHSAPIVNFSVFSHGFKGDHVSSTLQEMPPNLGLGQISQPDNSRYSNELEVARQGGGQYHELQQSRGFNSSVQHMNWPL